MKQVLMLILVGFVGLATFAQPKKVVEKVSVSGQEKLDLEFTFANDIAFIEWDKREVMVEVTVKINGGDDNDIFSMSSRTSTTTIYIDMDDDMWKKLSKMENGKWNSCSYSSEINYVVYLPKGLKVEANTISGNYELDFYGADMELKTISGFIDVTVPEAAGLDFKAKTISGEVFSDLEILYPHGKDGLRQIVGQDFIGQINHGGADAQFETISGNIYLRKGL